MAYIPPNPNGQTTAINSAPVVLASDKVVTVTANAGTNLNTSTLAVESGGNLAAIKIDTDKIPSQGQALAAASMPVVLTAAQVTTLTPPTTVTVTQGTAAAASAGWPVIGGELADTTGTFTNGTQTTSVTSNSFDGYSTVIVSISGTYGTATGVFEVSDDNGTTWYAVNAARSDGTGLETGYTSLTNTNRMWTLSVSGADEFRVRSTAVASGTVNARISVESMPTPEAASVSAYLTDGTNAANILKSDGTAAGQNAELVSGTGMTTATVTLNVGSPATTWYDLLNYPWISLEVLTNTAPSTLTFQTSGDASQTNIRSMVLQDSQSMANLGALSSASTVASLHGPRAGRYFRISSNVSGASTVTLVLTFYTTASALQTLGVQATQSGTWTVGSNSATGSAVPANAFYNGISDGTNLRGVLGAANALNSTGAGVPVAQIVGQFDDVSPTAITENQFGNIRMSTNRNLYGTIRDAAGNERGANVTASNELVVSDSGLRPAGTSLNTYSVHLTTNMTTTPTASTTYISSISISSEVAGTTSTVTIQDKSGTPLKLINGFSTTALTTTPTVVNFQTPVKMVSGIDIVTAGAVAATVDVWINYYQ